MPSEKEPVNIKPKVMMILDKREEHLIGEFEKKPKSIFWKSEQLPVGDICFQSKGVPVILIERKTLDDLDSSILDSRYKEQKMRILSSPVPKKLYLVEGVFHGFGKSLSLTGKSHSRLYGAIVNTSIRDGIPVLRTENLAETVTFLEKIYELVGRNEEFLKEPSSQANKYIEAIKVQKKENLTPEMCYLAQLCQIPGVSATIATRIRETYPNFKSLIDAYELCPGSKDRLLETLQLPNGRKVGPAVSKKVRAYLFFP